MLGLESIAMARHAGRMAASAARVWDVVRLILSWSPKDRNLYAPEYLLNSGLADKESWAPCLIPNQPREFFFEYFSLVKNSPFPW